MIGCPQIQHGALLARSLSKHWALTTRHRWPVLPQLFGAESLSRVTLGTPPDELVAFALVAHGSLVVFEDMTAVQAVGHDSLHLKRLSPGGGFRGSHVVVWDLKEAVELNHFKLPLATV